MRFYLGLALMPFVPVLAFLAVLVVMLHGFGAYLGVFAVLAFIGLLTDLDRRRRRHAVVPDDRNDEDSAGIGSSLGVAALRALHAVTVDAVGTAVAVAGLIGIALMASWIGHTVLAPRAALAGNTPVHVPPGLTLPAGITLDGHGDLYVTDELNLRVRRLSPAGRVDGSGIGGFQWPTRVTVGRDGRIYVADSATGKIEIFSPTGRYVTSWSAPDDFAYPMGMAFDRYDDLYVAVTDSNRVDEFSPRGELMHSWGCLVTVPANSPAPPVSPSGHGARSMFSTP